MPEDVGDKTEPPTPRRLQDARQQGQVARSQDLAAAVLLFVGFLGLGVLGPRLWDAMQQILRGAFTSESPTQLDDMWPFMLVTAKEVIMRLGPLLLVMFATLLAVTYAQVGWLLTAKPLIPSLSKINPISGFKRLFSLRMLMMAVTNLGKLLVVTVVGYLTISSSAAAIIYAFTLEYDDVFRLGASLMFTMGLRLAGALVILALFDFAWQKYKHLRDLRMTKEEVKDEYRSMEGDPRVKQRRRQVQFQLALQRLRKDVPTADVIVTNPTHVAVAIRYDAEVMVAPKVVAKGADHLALRIRQIAGEFGIPIVQRAPLARAIYADVEVGQFLPERFYQAVAEILAYVYGLAGRSVTGPRRNVAPAY